MATNWDDFTPVNTPAGDVDWSQFEPVNTPTPLFSAEPSAQPQGGFRNAAKQVAGQTLKGVGQAAADYLPGVGQDNALSRYGQSVVDANPTQVHDFASFAENPWTGVKEVAGNAAAPMGVAAGLVAAGRGLSVLPHPVAKAAGWGLQALGPLATFAAPSYSGIREQQMRDDPAMQDATGAKLAALGGAATVGAIEGRFGPQAWAARAVSKEGREALAEQFAAKSLKGAVGKGVLKGAAVEGAEELVQSPVEQLSGFQNPLTADNLADTAFSGFMGAVGGGVLGGGFGGLSYRRPQAGSRPNVNDATQPTDLLAPAAQPLQGPMLQQGMFEDDGTGHFSPLPGEGLAPDLFSERERLIDGKAEVDAYLQAMTAQGNYEAVAATLPLARQIDQQILGINAAMGDEQGLVPGRMAPVPGQMGFDFSQEQPAALPRDLLGDIIRPAAQSQLPPEGVQVDLGHPGQVEMFYPNGAPTYAADTRSSAQQMDFQRVERDAGRRKAYEENQVWTQHQDTRAAAHLAEANNPTQPTAMEAAFAGAKPLPQDTRRPVVNKGLLVQAGLRGNQARAALKKLGGLNLDQINERHAGDQVGYVAKVAEALQPLDQQWQTRQPKGGANVQASQPAGHAAVAQNLLQPSNGVRNEGAVQTQAEAPAVQQTDAQAAGFGTDDARQNANDVAGQGQARQPEGRAAVRQEEVARAPEVKDTTAQDVRDSIYGALEDASLTDEQVQAHVNYLYETARRGSGKSKAAAVEALQLLEERGDGEYVEKAKAQLAKIDKSVADREVQNERAEAIARQFNAQFSMAGEDPRRTPREDVVKELRALFYSGGRFNAFVSVVQSHNDLPMEVKEAAAGDAKASVAEVPWDKVQGFALGDRVYLIADNLSPGQVLPVFLHETGVHVGMERLIGKDNMTKLAGQVREWAEQTDGSLEATLARQALDRIPEDTPAVDRDEEAIAYFVEEAVGAGVNPTALGTLRGPLKGWFRTLWDAMTRALRRLGLNVQRLSARDFVDLAYGAAAAKMYGELEVVGATVPEPKFSVASQTADLVNRVEKAIGTNINAGHAAKTGLLSAQFTRWIVKNYAQLMPSLKKYWDTQLLQEKMAKDWVAKAAHAYRLTQQLPADVRKQLNALMKDATLGNVHVEPTAQVRDDYAKDVAAGLYAGTVEQYMNRHLTSSEQKAQLNKAMQAWGNLPAAAKDAYRALRDYNAQAWAERRAIYHALADETFNVRKSASEKLLADAREALATAEKDGDTKAVEKARKRVAEREDALKSLDHELRKAKVQYDHMMGEIKGDYFPLMRFGDFIVVKESRQLADLQAQHEQEPSAELEKKIAALKKMPAHYEVRAFESERAAEAFAKESAQPGFAVRQHLAHEFMAQQRGFNADALKKLTEYFRAAGLPATLQDQLVGMLHEQYWASLPEHSALQRQAKRQGIAGASDDMVRSFVTAAKKDAHYLSRLKFQGDVAEHSVKMKQEALDAGKDADRVYNEMMARRELDLVYKETPLQNFLLNLSYIKHLALSPAFMLNNSLQTLMLTLPVMSGKYGFGKSRHALQGAYADAFRILKAAFRQGATGWLFDLKTLDVTAEADVQKAAQSLGIAAGEVRLLKGLMDKGLIDPMMEHDVNAVVRFGEENAWTKAQQVMNFPVQAIELANRITTALAGYRLSQSEGYVEDLIADTQLDYTTLNAPRIARDGGPVPLAKLVFQFRKYQIGMLGLVGGLMKQAYGGDKAAMRSLGALFAAHGLMAGALGLPMMGAVTALATALGGLGGDDGEKWDAEVALRNWLADVFGADVARALSKGLPTMFGADLSGSLGMGNIASPVPYARGGKTAQETVKNFVMAAAGAPFGTIDSIASGLDYIHSGQVEKGLEQLLPRVAASPLRAHRYDAEGMTDRKGNVILPPDRFDGWDLALRAAGIATTKETEYYDANAAVQSAKGGRDDVRQRLMAEWVRARLAGDSDAQAEVRSEINDYNVRNPQARLTMADLMKSANTHRKQSQQRDDAGVRTQDKATRPYADLDRFAR